MVCGVIINAHYSWALELFAFLVLVVSLLRFECGKRVWVHTVMLDSMLSSVGVVWRYVGVSVSVSMRVFVVQFLVFCSVAKNS